MWFLNLAVDKFDGPLGHRADCVLRVLVKRWLVLEIPIEFASVGTGEVLGVDEGAEHGSGILAENVNLALGAFVKHRLRDISESLHTISEQTRRGCTYLDPAPDSGEEGGRVDDGDGTERLGVVGCRERRGLLEVRAEAPDGAECDVLEVDDGGDGGDGCRRGRVWEVSAEPEDEAGHGLVEGDAGPVSGVDG